MQTHLLWPVHRVPKPYKKASTLWKLGNTLNVCVCVYIEFGAYDGIIRHAEHSYTLAIKSLEIKWMLEFSCKTSFSSFIFLSYELKKHIS